MMRIALALAALVLIALPAVAQTPVPCADTADVTALLTGNKYAEAVVRSSTNAAGVLIEEWENPSTGTWTITHSRNGTSCLMRWGTGGLPKPGEPA